MALCRNHREEGRAGRTVNRQQCVVSGPRFSSEDIMQIHQPFDLVFGALMFLLGLIGVGRDVYRALAKGFPKAYADWRSLCLSVFFLVDGPTHVSRSFDMPHHPSPLTNTLDNIAWPFMLAALLGILAAFLVDQKGKRGRRTSA